MNEISEKQQQPYTIAGVTYRFIFGVTAVVFIALSVLYFAIWQGVEFAEYEWVYSANTTVKAGQYMMHGLWGMAFVTSPAWWLGLVMLSVKTLVKK